MIHKDIVLLDMTVESLSNIYHESLMAGYELIGNG